MRWLPILLYLVLLLYGIGFSFSPTLFSNFRRLQTDAGDTVLNHYILEHSWRCVSQADYRGTLWSPAFFYPEKDVLGYSDNLFGAALVYWLLRYFCDDVFSYQLWMMIGFAANFVAMAIALRWFGLNHALCALGAFLFAFGTPHVQQIAHQQLSYRCWTPFAIWHGWRFLLEPSGRRLFGCLFFVVWQFIATVYVGWFAAFGIGVVAVILIVTDRESRMRLLRFVREHPFSIAWPVLLNALPGAMLVIPYLRANEGYRREFSDALGGGAHWNSWLSVPPGTIWHPLLKSFDRDIYGERYLCGGLTFLTLGVLCVLALRRGVAAGTVRLLIRTFFLTVLALAALSFSFWINAEYGGASLWFVVHRVVPGAKAIRVVARVYLILYPLLTIAGLIALQLLLERSRLAKGGAAIAITALVAVAAMENHFSQREDPGRSFEHRPFYEQARAIGREIQGADAAYGVCEFSYPRYTHELTMMWAGLYANVPVINGYSSRRPHNYPFHEKDYSIEIVKGWLGNNWHGRLIVVWNGEPIRSEVWIIDSGGASRENAECGFRNAE